MPVIAGTDEDMRRYRTMITGLFIRQYKGLYFVEFSNRSVGMTLLAIWDKYQAESELKRFQEMSKQELKQYLCGRQTQ